MQSDFPMPRMRFSPQWATMSLQHRHSLMLCPATVKRPTQVMTWAVTLSPDSSRQEKRVCTTCDATRCRALPTVTATTGGMSGRSTHFLKRTRILYPCCRCSIFITANGRSSVSSSIRRPQNSRVMLADHSVQSLTQLCHWARLYQAHTWNAAYSAPGRMSVPEQTLPTQSFSLECGLTRELPCTGPSLTKKSSWRQAHRLG